MRNILLLLFMMSYHIPALGAFQQLVKDLTGVGLSYPRSIYIYLPPGYEKSKINYPVIYMQDGQNLYDPKRAYLGQTWEAEKSLDALILQRKITPVIVVAIDNSLDRKNEYTPGPVADAYLRFIVRNVKPLVESKFRVKKGREHTGIIGSSLGGLVSLYAGVEFSKHFGLIGALSPSIWWNGQEILGFYDRAQTLPLKIYVDSGTVGGERPQDVESFTTLLLQRVSGERILRIIQTGGEHREIFWAQRFPLALKYLLPPQF